MEEGFRVCDHALEESRKSAKRTKAIFFITISFATAGSRAAPDVSCRDKNSVLQGHRWPWCYRIARNGIPGVRAFGEMAWRVTSSGRSRPQSEWRVERCSLGAYSPWFFFVSRTKRFAGLRPFSETVEVGEFSTVE